VVSIHWGVRRSKGRPCPEDCVVIYVTSKRSTDIVPKPNRFPRELRVRHQNRTYVVPIDLQAIAGVGVGQSASQVRPGANRRLWIDNVTTVHNGTLGALVRDGQQRIRAVLSGHVALTTGRQVFVESRPNTTVDLGSVEQLVRDSNSDIAWTAPIAVDPNVPTRPVSNVRDLTLADRRTAVTVLVARDFRGLTSFVDDIDVSGPIRFADGVVNMTGMVALSPQVTEPGDSGAPVIDANGALVGFVVGTLGTKTVLISARRALDDLER